MVGRLPIQLLNVFAQIGLYTIYTNALQIIIKMDLFGYHALALDQRLAFLLATDTPDRIQCLLCIFGPDNLSPTARNGSLKEFQLFVERSDRFPLCILGTLTSQFQIHELLLALRHNGIVLANIEIDLAPVLPIAGLDGALG